MTAPAPGSTATPAVGGQPGSGQHSLRLARVLAGFGIAGALVAVIGVGTLHLLPQTADIDIVRRTISEYALTELGWVFNLGVAGLAIGSLAILASLVLAGRARGGSLGIALGLIWSAALLVVMVFPKHNWAVGPSTNGSIHRVASIVAFVCLPVAVLLLTRRPGGSRGRRPIPARLASWLAIGSLAWFGVLLGAWALTPITGKPWWQAVPLGVVERGLVISEVLAVIALGCWALCAPTSAMPRTSEARPSRHPQPASQAPTEQAR
ncbi:MAG: DUF998 domain-containing protein [Nakamurella sp.]